MADAAVRIGIAGLDLTKTVSRQVTQAKFSDLQHKQETQKFHQKVAAVHEGGLCGTTGTRCRAGLVCSPMPKGRNTRTEAFNNGRCVDYNKERRFKETCDATGTLHCDPKWACMDDETASLMTAATRLFTGQTPHLRRCLQCQDDHDCLGERWCGTSDGGWMKSCQDGAKQSRVLDACARVFSYNGSTYNNKCVTSPKLRGPNWFKYSSWCPTRVNENLEYTEAMGAPANKGSFDANEYQNILFCPSSGVMPE